MVVENVPVVDEWNVESVSQQMNLLSQRRVAGSACVSVRVRARRVFEFCQELRNTEELSCANKQKTRVVRTKGSRCSRQMRVGDAREREVSNRSGM